MTQIQYLLITLMEECDEVSQRCSKALRFGLHEIQPEQPLDNETRIMEEICDFRGVVRYLQELGVFHKLLDMQWVNARARAKIEKLVKYMEYSKQRGIIDGVHDNHLRTNTEAARHDDGGSHDPACGS